MANAFGRLQTRPRERSPAAWRTRERVERGVDGLGALEVEHGGERRAVEVGRRPRDPQPAAGRALDADEERGLGERLGQGVALVDGPGVVDLVRVLLRR